MGSSPTFDTRKEIIMGPGTKKNKLREVFDSIFDDDAILEQTGGYYDPYDDWDSEDGELPWEDPFDMDFDDIF